MGQEVIDMEEVQSIRRKKKSAKVVRLVSFTDRQSLRELLAFDERSVMFSANSELCFCELEKFSCQSDFVEYGYLMKSKQVLSVGTPGNIPAMYGDQFQFMAGSQFVFVKAVQD